MRVPPSPHFEALDLSGAFNADRAGLAGGLTLRRIPLADWTGDAFGLSDFCGIPFRLGEGGHPNVIHLEANSHDAVTIDLAGRTATYIIFLHAVADRVLASPPGFGDIGPSPEAGRAEGNALGDHVSTYRLAYADGEMHDVRVLRRFAIQQRHIPWSASAFAAVPAAGPKVYSTASDDHRLGRSPAKPWGESETRHHSGRATEEAENLWLYALPNPRPDAPLSALRLVPGTESSVIYGIAVTKVLEHPLRPQARRSVRISLPREVPLNELDELDTDDRGERIGIDLGTIISARAALDYDPACWLSGTPEVQPVLNRREVIVDCAAHPDARLYIRADDGSLFASDLFGPSADRTLIREIGAPARSVRVRVIDSRTRTPLPVRIHIHGSDGQYLPPRGHHRRVNSYWFEDNYGEFLNGLNQYAYIDGTCEVDLPIGTVFVEISRGYEFTPLRVSVEVLATTEDLEFTLEHVLRWRERNWVTADTHVHFLSPQTALLEARAEGVNVVNLLAAQWGEMFSNVADFDGMSTLGSREAGGDGEHLVRVGTENRMQVLGHISLLGYRGPMILPLSTGGPSEAAIGDRLEVAMAEWAEQCRRQGGLVVMPHAPNPQAERAADIVLGLVDAIEMMTFNPRDAQVNPFGLVDWYRYQNIGFQLPLVAGSDKMSAASLLGGIRTYARLAGEFIYENWMAAVRNGDTFVTVGPLIELLVEGVSPGRRVDLPAGGGHVTVEWRAESVSVPIDVIEIVVGGMPVDAIRVGALANAGSTQIALSQSTWIALRVRGGHRGVSGDIAAHTSAVQVVVGGRPVFIEADASAVLEQIEGAIAYVDTLATRPGSEALARIRAYLSAAHDRLHARIHRHGMHHHHTPLHSHDHPREH